MLRADKVVLPEPPELLELLKTTDQQAVVLASGEPNFFGVGRFLLRNLPKERLEIFANVTSMQYAFARMSSFATADARVRRRHPLRHRRLARLGHRHLVGRGGGLREGRLHQRPHRDVPGNRHDARAWAERRSPALPTRAIAVLFGVALLVSACSRSGLAGPGRQQRRQSGCGAPQPRLRLSDTPGRGRITCGPSPPGSA